MLKFIVSFFLLIKHSIESDSIVEFRMKEILMNKKTKWVVLVVVGAGSFYLFI